MEMLLTISLAFMFYNIVRSERLVVNTTCLELAEPSNQQFRLYCKNASYYHCLLDEYSIKEFEVCMKWKWISKGNCAYFNTYGDGNIDGRQCFNLTNFECPTVVHLSTENMKYPACYVKNTTSTISPSASSFQSTFEDTTESTTKITIDEKNSAAYPIADTPYEQSEKAHKASAIAIGVIIPLLIFSVILCYLYIKGKNRATNNSESRVGEMDERAEPEENQHQNERRENGLESSEGEKDDSNTEQKPLLNEMKTSSENPPLIRCEMEKSLTGKGMKDETDPNDDKEKPAGSISGSYHDLQQLDNEEDKEESTDLFDDTFESLQQIPQEIVKLNEDDDEQLSHDSSSAVATTNEAGKTVTE
nr:uncharacterized protein LOC117685076 isoform X2 [Crassostrea gigas]